MSNLSKKTKLNCSSASPRDARRETLTKVSSTNKNSSTSKRHAKSRKGKRSRNSAVGSAWRTSLGTESSDRRIRRKLNSKSSGKTTTNPPGRASKAL